MHLENRIGCGINCIARGGAIWHLLKVVRVIAVLGCCLTSLICRARILGNALETKANVFLGRGGFININPGDGLPFRR